MRELKSSDVSLLETIRCNLLSAEIETEWALGDAIAFFEEIGLSVPADEVRDTIIELCGDVVKQNTQMKKLGPDEQDRLEGIRCDLLHAEMEVKWILDDAAAFLERIELSIPGMNVRDLIIRLRNVSVGKELRDACPVFFGFLRRTPDYLRPLRKACGAPDILRVSGDPVEDADGIKEVIESIRKNLRDQEAVLARALRAHGEE